jgi:aspartate carbamoyltransferase catalytic subunit
MNILKVDDLSEDHIERIFSLADIAKSRKSCLYHPVAKNAEGRFLATLFFEPSTRTRLSFETAMKSLGGQVITVENGVSSSAMKGETLSDTLTTVSQYADTIVVRTKEQIEPNNLRHIRTPIINAGDGDGEHPTQALLDLYTIRQYFQGHFNILFMGDLEHGRTIHSLIQLLARYDCTIYHRCPSNRKLPPDLRKLSHDAECNWRKRVLPEMDVVYCSREQKERAHHDSITNYGLDYGLKGAEPSDLKDGAIVMHPLPRGDEIGVGWDRYECAKYFEQTKNGVYVRMGILMDALELSCPA